MIPMKYSRKNKREEKEAETNYIDIIHSFQVLFFMTFYILLNLI